jgi:cytochrome b561
VIPNLRRAILAVIIESQHHQRETVLSMTEHDHTKPASTQPREAGGTGIEPVEGDTVESETVQTTRGKGEADEERLTAAQPPSEPPPSQPTRSQSPPSQPPAVARYDVVSSIFHWSLVLLVLTQLGLGWSLHSWPGAIPERQAASWVHHSLGLSITILVFVAVLWRLTFASVKYSALTPAWVRPSERATAIILYFLLILLPLTGYLSLVFAGKAVYIWSWTVPSWGWKDADLSDLYSRWHNGAAIALSGAFLFHVLLVLVARLQERHVRSRKRAPQAVNVNPPPPQKAAPSWEGPTAETRGLAFHLRIFGWIGFWAQLSLGVVSVLLLVVTASSTYYSASSLHIRFLSWAQGVFWAHFATALLALTVIGFFYCTRLAKGLRGGLDPTRCQHRITRLVSGINFGSSLGLTIAILGTAFSIALLIAKTVAQPPGIAITDPQKIVRAVDVFVLLANFNIVVAHFVGILTCLWMLNRVHRFYLPLELARAAAGSEGAGRELDASG